MNRTDIRLALPSKGRLEPETLAFLHACGLTVHKPNPRQYEAIVPRLPGLRVIFQRPGDIVVGVQQGSLDIGITGLDMVTEKRRPGSDLLVIHEALGYGQCQLVLAVPEAWSDVWRTADLKAQLEKLGKSGGGLRVATKFPQLTGQYLAAHDIAPVRLIEAEGTLEVAPAVGYADLIADLVSTGTTLRDNRLRPLVDGTILDSQAVLIGNRASLVGRPEALELVRQMLEYVEAHLRGESQYNVLANVRGESGQAIAQRMLASTQLSGLQGPTIAPVYHPQQNGQRWFAVNIIVAQDRLSEAIAELRQIGGSGVIVTPVTYIFEEEPARFQKLVADLEAHPSREAKPEPL
jgi:ATP phosphoribosyltransferase